MENRTSHRYTGLPHTVAPSQTPTPINKASEIMKLEKTNGDEGVEERVETEADED